MYEGFSVALSQSTKYFQCLKRKALKRFEVIHHKKRYKDGETLNIISHQGIVDLNYNDIPSPTTANSKCCWDMDTYVHCWWEYKMVQTL